MSALRAWTSTCLLALLGFVTATASSCGTEAVGIDDCRDIEKARCSAGKQCGLIDDVEACQRFYRDQCLHGLAAKPPANAAVDRCVNAIVAAGNSGACEVVQAPEKTEECAFLLPEPMPPPDASSPDTGGSAGAAGAANDGGGGGGPL